MRRTRHVLLSLGLAAALAGLVIGSASATYPGGSNGDLNSIGISDRPVFVMNADGSNQHRITTAPIMPGVPAWQPLHVDED